MNEDDCNCYFGYNSDVPVDLGYDPFDDFDDFDDNDPDVWDQIPNFFGKVSNPLTAVGEKNEKQQSQNTQNDKSYDYRNITNLILNPNSKIQNQENGQQTNQNGTQNSPTVLNDHTISTSIKSNFPFQQISAKDKNQRCSISSRKILSLTGGPEEFRIAFYHLTYGKKFSKLYVQKLHNAVCNSLNLRRMNREESRSIKLYFLHFAKDGFKIINAIRSYLEENPDLVNEIDDSRSK